MALSNARETYFRVQRQTSYEESVSDAERERDIVDTQNGHKSCRNSRISDKDVKILATVSILALLFSVIAIAMVTVQWVIMKSSVETSGRILDDARNQEHISTEARFDDEVSNKPGQHGPDHILSQSPGGIIEPGGDCPTSQMRRGEKRSATSRRGRTRHKNCHNAFRGSATLSHNQTTAIHFQGFPPGIYHLAHADGAYVWWRPATWYRHMTGFHYNHSTGHVTIRSPGLYFIYSQMVHTENIGQTYAIVINNNVFLKCTKSTPVTDQGSTYEASCYTGGATILHRNDQIWIRGIHTSGRVTISPESTFWGLICLGTLDIEP
ncbi:hypothetical protein LSH36_615g00029 [Paralvinella palmiformis]|uniref:THD domain-containing protein n=1 Tax=Paralvinella palmiformis TaxID=53620 RepID=A0AAD9J483_9ANNE|nr:hypothetical protein LSH36_615g00029 [Paralvinella palmiformis]